MAEMRILAIETSCDDTSLALVEAKGGLKNPSFKILKNLISSQIKTHRPFGGVVPNLAKREHLKNLPILFRQIFKNFQFPISNFQQNSKFQKSKIQNIDLIAVTVGPGLEPALWTGINFAKELHNTLNPKPNTLYPKIVGVNHLEGHIYSNILQNVGISFPAICLSVSGGHTILLKMDSLTKWKKLGETRDDAAGEAFDKVARLLNLSYPGGPEIEKLAKKGNQKAIDFPRPMIHDKNYEFSFSGLKTSVLYYLRGHSSTNNESRTNERIDQSTSNESGANKRIRKFEKNSLFVDIAASFQQAVIDVLVKKTIRAAREFGAKSVLLCGGVAANRALRNGLAISAKRLAISFHVPDFEYNTDNAAMIAAAGYINFLRKKKYRITAQSNLNL